MHDLTKLAIRNQIERCDERLQELEGSIRYGKDQLARDESDLLKFLIAREELEALLK